MTARPTQRRSRRPLTGVDRVTLAAGFACLIAGIVVLAAASGFAAVIVGIVLLGLAGIDFVALAFLLVGESEDRENARRTR
jgi:O-acetylhomoserine/O-acetylserine sulfhydrylase-like pyridoxal-dependent enzyme